MDEQHAPVGLDGVAEHHAPHHVGFVPHDFRGDLLTAGKGDDGRIKITDRISTAAAR